MGNHNSYKISSTSLNQNSLLYNLESNFHNALREYRVFDKLKIDFIKNIQFIAFYNRSKGAVESDIVVRYDDRSFEPFFISKSAYPLKEKDFDPDVNKNLHSILELMNDFVSIHDMFDKTRNHIITVGL